MYVREKKCIQNFGEGGDRISCRGIGWEVDGTVPESQAVMVTGIRGIIL